MDELMKLTPAEQFLADTNMTITLKEIADRYNKRHRNLKSTFSLALSKLSEENHESIRVAPITIPVKSGTGKVEKMDSFILDIKTMLWFMTKFDENMRMDVINYAFEKLEKEKTLAIDEAKKPRIYYDGNMSVRRCISEAWEDDDENVPNESDVWDALIWKGFAETKAKVTTMKVIPSALEGHVGAMKNRGFATYKPNTIKSVWLEFEEAGKPVRSEHERLVEEFEEISQYYKDKISKNSQ